MNIEGLTTEKCEQRNRIVANREEIEGAPIRFLAGTAADWTATEIAGQMPEDADGALRLINASLPDDAAPLTSEDVFIHYLEAASDAFIGDRYMFLSESTLRNIAEDAASGFAFMNSHRTGSMSTPSELPFGKTFAGQYQAGVDGQGRKRKRAVVGVYMLRGIKPNGEAGPTTNDLDRMIRGGQVADVSVGLTRGEKLCDTCGGTLAECPHVPGTRRAMTDDQVSAQTQRGIPGGRSSYTLDNARCGEVSAVFSGAVPGAGVKKVMAFKSAGKLNHRELKDARMAFGSLLSGDFSMDTELFDQISGAVAEGVRSGLQTQATEQTAAAITEGVKEMAEEKTNLSTDQSGAIAELEAKLKAQADQLASLAVDKEKAEAEAKANAERVTKLETAQLQARFESEVKGHTGGKMWFGDHTKHVRFLMDLAGAFGADSEQVKFYTEQHRAFAAQMEESALFAEMGGDAEKQEDGALFELNAIAAKLQEGNKNLTHEQAFAVALDANPALYDRYRAEQKGGK